MKQKLRVKSRSNLNEFVDLFWMTNICLFICFRILLLFVWNSFPLQLESFPLDWESFSMDNTFQTFASSRLVSSRLFYSRLVSFRLVSPLLLSFTLVSSLFLISHILPARLDTSFLVWSLGHFDWPFCIFLIFLNLVQLLALSLRPFPTGKCVKFLLIGCIFVRGRGTGRNGNFFPRTDNSRSGNHSRRRENHPRLSGIWFYPIGIHFHWSYNHFRRIGIFSSRWR